MEHKILDMLELQDAMNRRIAADWRDRGFAWYRAIWTECAEMLDHYGWKWWKHQEPDMAQVRLEIVDIWHFALSIRLAEGGATRSTARAIASDLERPAAVADLREAIERMAEAAIRTRGADIAVFAALLELADMGFDDLYKTYVGKNELNRFRQDHGYKEGRYRKTWHGREDNDHLAGILESLDADADDFAGQVYGRLAETYPG